MRNMKDSGIEWIGEIPKDWRLPKVKNLFNIGRGRVIGQIELKDNGLYPVFSSQTKNNGCLGYINTYDFDRSQLTWTTDGANAGTVFLRKGKHNCTNVCGTLSPKNNDNSLNYMKYSLEYIAIYHKRADTNGYKIMNNEMAEIKITLPPLEEQELIADYLDKKVQEIDNIISKTQETIEEYKKYKQSVITEAVTKGLNPSVEMKESGIEWIGKIPKDWEIVKLKTVTTQIIDGTHSTPNYVSEGIPFLRVTDISSLNNYNTNIDFKNVARITQKEHNELIKRCKPEKGDLLVSKNGTIGVPKIVDWDYDFSIFVSLCLIKVKKNIDVNFLYYYFKSSLINMEISIGGKTGTITNLHLNKIREFNIPFPIKEEQINIVNYLNIKCSQIDSLISKKQELITQLETYKKSLIYECITGKKEVALAYAY